MRALRIHVNLAGYIGVGDALNRVPCAASHGLGPPEVIDEVLLAPPYGLVREIAVQPGAGLRRVKRLVQLGRTPAVAGRHGMPHVAGAEDASVAAVCHGPCSVHAEANSDDFAHGYASITSSANSYRSQSDLDADVATLHSPKLSRCIEKLTKKQLAASMPAGSRIESVSIKITPGSAGGPANVVATGTGTITVRVNDQQVPVYLTVAFITGPLTEAEVNAENVGTPLPASLVNPLVAAVATRAAKG